MLMQSKRYNLLPVAGDGRQLPSNGANFFVQTFSSYWTSSSVTEMTQILVNFEKAYQRICAALKIGRSKGCVGHKNCLRNGAFAVGKACASPLRFVCDCRASL